VKRNIEKLTQQEFDIIVVGAGIHGACIARDAAMRGLSVALIDKGDLCGQTSHNSLKIIHGGLRYLQHLNIKRTLDSIKEQKIWLTIAPHLVKPMQCVMPTYGHGIRGPEVMWCGIKAYELLGLGKNRNIPDHRKIPGGSVISREKCLQMIPGIDSHNLTGAAVWYDAQVFAADEAVIEIAASAAQHGAQVANYVSAEKILLDEQKVTGIQAKDELSNKTFNIRGKLVINASGPWTKKVLSTLNISKLDDYCLPLTKSMNIVTRPLFGDYAVAIKSKNKSDSVVGSTKRLYFFTPWKNCTITGTTHFPYDGNPDSLNVSKEEVQQFVSEINDVAPQANLALDDVLYCYVGLTPAEKNQPTQNSNEKTTRSHQSKIIDHSTDGIEGLVSAIGIKYTTARLTAEKSVDIACYKLGKANQKCHTRTKPLDGSTTELIDVETINDVDFRKYCNDKIKKTMAVHLTDLVLRRMNLTMQGKLTPDKLTICRDVLAEKFSWNEKEKTTEINNLNKALLRSSPSKNLDKILSGI
jgi:glycerol-3-phosphate dehydrogenase